MAHQLLNDLHVLTIRDKQSGVGMAKRVPRNMFADFGLEGCRLNDLLQNRSRPHRSTSLMHADWRRSSRRVASVELILSLSIDPLPLGEWGERACAKLRFCIDQPFLDR